MTEQDEVKKRIGDLFDFAFSEAGRAQIESYCTLPSDVAAIVSGAISAEAENYQCALDTSAIRHIMKQHGTERERLRGQIPIAREDFMLLPDVAANPDVAEYAGTTRQGLHTIRLEKTFGEETVFAIKEIRTGREYLALVTLYKRRKRPV